MQSVSQAEKVVLGGGWTFVFCTHNIARICMCRYTAGGQDSPKRERRKVDANCKRNKEV